MPIYIERDNVKTLISKSFIYDNKPDSIFINIKNEYIILNRKDIYVQGIHHKWYSFLYESTYLNLKKFYFTHIKNKKEDEYVVYVSDRYLHYADFECTECKIQGTLHNVEPSKDYYFESKEWTTTRNISCNEYILQNILE